MNLFDKDKPSENFITHMGEPWPPRVTYEFKRAIKSRLIGVSVIFFLLGAASSIFFSDITWEILYSIHPAMAYGVTASFLLMLFGLGILFLVDGIRRLKGNILRHENVGNCIIIWFFFMITYTTFYWFLHLINPSFVDSLEPIFSSITGLSMLALFFFFVLLSKKEARPIFRWVLYFILLLLVLPFLMIGSMGLLDLWNK